MRWEQKKINIKKKSVRHNEKYAENSNDHNAFSLWQWTTLHQNQKIRTRALGALTGV